jgi:hypothetical protein
VPYAAYLLYLDDIPNFSIFSFWLEESRDCMVQMREELERVQEGK